MLKKKSYKTSFVLFERCLRNLVRQSPILMKKKTFLNLNLK